MKKKEILKQIIRDFHLSPEFALKPREFKVPFDTQKIITLIGVRRSGKTSILYEAINRLSQEIDKTKIVFVNFEDERLELGTDELDLILQAYRELYPAHNLNECYFFFDEIQNVNGWEKFIRRIYDTLSQNIFITGSNSKLLSSDIATSLRGRTLSFEILPLSFREYLWFNDIEIDLYSTASLSYIQNAQERFLRVGAFPEIVFLDDRYRNKILQEYFNVMIYKDLIERYAIKNTAALKFFIKRILASSTKAISINKLYNELKSNGIKIGKNSLYEYLEYVQNIYLSLVLQRYDTSLVNQELGEKKIYSIDVGLSNAVEFHFSDNIGKSLENMVFLELRRRGETIFYHRDERSECDFILQENNRITQAIQVTYSLQEEETKLREIKGALTACKAYNLSQATIITYDHEDTITQDGVRIEIIPFYKWVLL